MKHLDKLKHLAVFGVAHYAFLACLVWTRLPVLLAIAIATLVIAVAAFVTEDRQKQQEGRVKDGWDAFANMVGASLSLLVFAFTHNYWVAI